MAHYLALDPERLQRDPLILLVPGLDDGDSAHGAVRAALLCDERARDVLPEGECRATEGQEERE